MNRKVKYLCPCCFKDTKIQILKFPTPKFDSTDYMLGEDVENLELITECWLTIKGKCSKCGYEGEFIDIDDGFVELIQYLNANNYETVYCCTGHEIKDENNYDHPYLVFKCRWDDKTYSNILRHLPKSWKIYRKYLYNSKNFLFDSQISLYCDNYYKYPDCMKDLEEFIYKWFPKNRIVLYDD
jgi:hypothetical protein